MGVLNNLMLLSVEKGYTVSKEGLVFKKGKEIKSFIQKK